MVFEASVPPHPLGAAVPSPLPIAIQSTPWAQVQHLASDRTAQEGAAPSLTIPTLIQVKEFHE